jgi:dienelactone hydrolase
MSIQILITALALFITVTGAIAANIVTFKGEDHETVAGRLTKPEGKGPFPAVILLHGFDGMGKHYDAWVARLSSWGYLTLQMDSFGEKEKPSALGPPSERAQDICDAKSYLVGLPYVDPNRIGVIGWALRGASTFTAFCVRSSALKRENPFRAAVAFYPYCYKALFASDFPVLILIGERDDWTPSSLCRKRMPPRQTKHEVTLKVYPGAYHCFDVVGADTSYMGHRIQYDPAAAADAILQVKNFFAKHLRKK